MVPYHIILDIVSFNTNYQNLFSNYRNDEKEDSEDKFAAKFVSCEGPAARLWVREEIDILFSLNHQNILRY